MIIIIIIANIYWGLITWHRLSSLLFKYHDFSFSQWSEEAIAIMNTHIINRSLEWYFNLSLFLQLVDNGAGILGQTDPREHDANTTVYCRLLSYICTIVFPTGSLETYD